jgi:hypothetical protein
VTSDRSRLALLVVCGVAAVAGVGAVLAAEDAATDVGSAVGSDGPPTSPIVLTVPVPTGAVPLEITVAPTTVDPLPDTSGGLNPLGGDSPEDRRMPDVVCMDLQAAQDEIQDRGVFLSRSEDASGEGRRQIWDRNWVVVDQSPQPGEPIGERDAILYVLKDDEVDSC